MLSNSRRLMHNPLSGDMFACCDTATPSKPESVLELHDKSGELAALLRLLHDPPVLPVELPRENKSDPVRFDPATIIPLPLLKPLLSEMSDKYGLDEDIIGTLRAHLEAHAAAHGLEVYGFASANEFEWEASTASQYILPLASYRFDEIKVIPNVVAYHKIVRLQDFRVKALRDLLLGEELFPHGQCFPSQIFFSQHICRNGMRYDCFYFRLREMSISLGNIGSKLGSAAKGVVWENRVW